MGGIIYVYVVQLYNLFPIQVAPRALAQAGYTLPLLIINICHKYSKQHY